MSAFHRGRVKTRPTEFLAQLFSQTLFAEASSHNALPKRRSTRQRYCVRLWPERVFAQPPPSPSVPNVGLQELEPRATARPSGANSGSSIASRTCRSAGAAESPEDLRTASATRTPRLFPPCGRLSGEPLSFFPSKAVCFGVLHEVAAYHSRRPRLVG